MVVLQTTIPVPLESRSEVLRSLRRILGETRAWPGCISCHLCADMDGESTSLVLIERWADLQSLSEHIRSANFRVVLSALDCAREQPEIRCDVIARTMGMSYIRACRQGGSASGPQPGSSRADY